MTKFYLIRHGSTNAIGKFLTGRSPGLFLNEEGINQVKKLTQNLKGIPFSAVYCSPLERTLQTAGIISKSFNLTCIPSDNFLEIDFGDWTNLSIEELKKDPLFSQFNSFRSCTKIPNGESILEAQKRIVDGLQNLYYEHPDQTIAVISHADPIRLAIGYFAGIHMDLLHRIEISPASVSIIELYEETVRILMVNG